MLYRLVSKARQWWDTRHCAVCNVYLVWSWKRHNRTALHQLLHIGKPPIHKIGVVTDDSDGLTNIGNWYFGAREPGAAAIVIDLDADEPSEMIGWRPEELRALATWKHSHLDLGMLNPVVPGKIVVPAEKD